MNRQPNHMMAILTRWTLARRSRRSSTACLRSSMYATKGQPTGCFARSSKRDPTPSVGVWAEQEKKRANHQEAFFWDRFGTQLRRWVQQQIAERGGGRKCLDLPAGRLGFRAGKEKLVVCDEQAALAWADTHCPQAIRVQRRLMVSELQQHLTDTGEVPEGVSVQPAGESFYVKKRPMTHRSNRTEREDR